LRLSKQCRHYHWEQSRLCIAYSTVRYLPALVGAAVALLLAWLAYRFRDALRLGWETVVGPLVRLHRRLQASAEDHYRELVARGHPQLAILGTPGAGRTTLLAHLAFVCARPTETGTTLGLPQGRLPLYVPLPAMDWDEINHEGEQGERGAQKGDEVERLTMAALAAAGGSSRLGRPLRQRLEAGQSIVLADGWDELLPQQRQRAAAWLAYAPLTEAGFVPLTLASWDVEQVETFARQWVEVCAPADESPTVVLRELAAKLRRAARAGSSPLELALRAFVHLSDGQSPAKRVDLFEQTLDLLLWQEQEEKAWLSAACRVTLGQVALELHQEERTTASREEIEAAIEAALSPPEERPARAVAHVFRALTGERGLLHPAGTNRYAFVHPLWQGYLAARQMGAVAPASLVERLDDPRWADVLRFYVELGDMGPLVTAWLRSPDDMFHTRLCTLSSWINVAPEGATWRDGAMAMLARGFLQPGQPAITRQALAEALATTGVPGVTYLFKQALQHPNEEVRTAAVLGLARIAGESDLPDLEAALSDEDPAVRQAAVRGLAYLNIDAATRLLERVLLEGDETVGGRDGPASGSLWTGTGQGAGSAGENSTGGRPVDRALGGINGTGGDRRTGETSRCCASAQDRTLALAHLVGSGPGHRGRSGRCGAADALAYIE
jgi:hypothetical protein